jgi:hypothetical protein
MIHMFNKSIKAVGVLAGLLTAATLGFAGTANATTTYTPSGYQGDQSLSSYTSDLVAAGVPGVTYAGASKVGHMVCEKLDEGVSEDMLLGTVYGTPGFTMYSAHVVVWSAEWHFCPNHY